MHQIHVSARGSLQLRTLALKRAGSRIIIFPFGDLNYQRFSALEMPLESSSCKIWRLLSYCQRPESWAS